MTKPDVDLHLKRFKTVLAGLKNPEESYRFYEQSHRIWQETTPEAIRTAIKADARFQPGINAPIWGRPRFYLFKVDEHTKSVYFAVSDNSEFDWHSLSRPKDCAVHPG